MFRGKRIKIKEQLPSIIIQPYFYNFLINKVIIIIILLMIRLNLNRTLDLWKITEHNIDTLL